LQSVQPQEVCPSSRLTPPGGDELLLQGEREQGSHQNRTSGLAAWGWPGQRWEETKLEKNTSAGEAAARNRQLSPGLFKGVERSLCIPGDCSAGLRARDSCLNILCGLAVSWLIEFSQILGLLWISFTFKAVLDNISGENQM